MKTLITATVLRLATSVSLALIATVSSAHAQTAFTETIELRTGADSAGVALPVGSSDDDITQNISHSGVNCNAALNGAAAKIISPHSAWVSAITDSEARWIHSTHSPGSDGSGSPADDILYAQGFELPQHMPSNAKVTVDMEFSADDRLGSVNFNCGTALAGFSSGNLAFQTINYCSISDTAGNLGLIPGENDLFVWQRDTGGQYSGLIYSITITVEYCILELDLRSGVTEGAAGPILLPVGADDPSVMQVPLPASPGLAYSTLASNGGSVAKRVSPNTAWVTNLSDTAGWINPNHQSGTVNGSGRPPTSALYAHDFQLPPVPQNAVVFLDLEWAADETLYGVSLNDDVTQPGGNLGIGGGLAAEFASASSAQFLGTAGGLNLSQGSNKLYLSQLENFPGTSYQDNPKVCSGIMYIAKLTIAFPCESDTNYETFCDCPLVIAPCGNAGASGQGCANSTGAGSQLTATGAAITGGGSTLQLHASNLPTPQTIGLFFQGNNVLNPMPFGDGLRCVGGSIERLEVVITATGTADSAIIVGPASSGVKFYQFWYRDAPFQQSPCNSGFNLTNGVALGWN